MNALQYVLFNVAEISSPPILGFKTSTWLDLIRRDMKVHYLPDFYVNYSNCFGEIGCLQDKHRIVVDNNIPPVISPSRRILASLKSKLSEELKRMTEMKIITPV